MKSRYVITLTAVTFAAALSAAVGLSAQGGGQGGPPPPPPKPGQLAPDRGFSGARKPDERQAPEGAWRRRQFGCLQLLTP